MTALAPTITDASVTLTWGTAGRYYGYCTIADVTFEFPNASLYTKLSNSAVAQEITNAAQEIQDQLARFYQMPYAGTDQGILLTLRDLNAKLAVANIIDRNFQDNEPDLSTHAAHRRGWVELMLTDLKDGVIQWASPFGDAVTMSEHSIYPMSAAATVMPDPNSFDPYTANPVFSMGRTTFRRNQAF